MAGRTVSVNPETFTMVLFDGERIRAIAAELADRIGLAPEIEIRVDVDETVPLGNIELSSTDPILLTVEGGAFEDPKRPRQLGEETTAAVIGRLLFQARDRLDPSFGAPPIGDALLLPLRVAWEVSCAGRFARLGYEGQRQRWLYAFRNRHGFTDDADAAFSELWEGDGLTFADIERLSDTAAAAKTAPA